MVKPPATHFQWQGETLVLHCHVQPKATRDEIVGVHDNRLKIRIAAPPVDGQANRHLAAVLAKSFGVPKTRVEVLRGHSARLKTVAIVAPGKLPAACEIPSESAE